MSKGKNEYVDFHCHPAMKPFGKSFKRRNIGKNHPRKRRRNSIWHYNPPSLLDKLINMVTGLTKFSQSNFTSMAKGDISVACASLYPIEKGFFENKIGNEFLKDVIANFATGVGKRRVDAVQGMKNYFKDLEMEYDFYRQLDNRVIRISEGKCRYKLVKNYAELEAIKANKSKLTTIGVVLTIEGMHVLNSDLKNAPVESDYIRNIQKIKAWECPPFFVSIAHHFWNHLCGHAESFNKTIKRFIDQSEMMDTGFTSLGKAVLHELLDDTRGKRILIDIKHMSVASRKEFYAILDSRPEYQNVPILVSHGAANGLKSFNERVVEGSNKADKLKRADINFFNNEIIRLAKSKGILGLQLDERRIANKRTLKDTKHAISRSKIMHYRSELLWNQVQHILEVLDNEGLFAWDCLALGTDFDGIIDPLNGFWTAEELPYLADFLERHAFNYMENANLKLAANKIKANEIVHRLMTSNGMNFLKEHFR